MFDVARQLVALESTAATGTTRTLAVKCATRSTIRRIS